LVIVRLNCVTPARFLSSLTKLDGLASANAWINFPIISMRRTVGSSVKQFKKYGAATVKERLNLPLSNGRGSESNRMRLNYLFSYLISISSRGTPAIASKPPDRINSASLLTSRK